MSLFNKIWFWTLTLINYIVPQNRDIIVIYGRRMLNDNAEALLDYLLANKYNQKYKIYVLISKNVIHAYKGLMSFKIVNSSLCSVWYVTRAKYIFHTHGLSLCKHIPCRGQIIFNLWHGSPLKAIGKMIGQRVTPEADTYFLCASPFFVDINKKCFGITDEQVFIGSNPRNDYLFTKKDVKGIMGWNSYSKVIVFMPTFRTSKGLNRSDAEKDFPILNKNTIRKLDGFLQKQNALLVIKPHPYQNTIGFLNRYYSNIQVLYNKDIHTNGIKLYELLGCSDALITDFSSVYFDYMLLNRPLAFAIDDMASYGTNRGFAIDEPINFMPGMKMQSIEDLQEFIVQVSKNEDSYIEERKKVNEICNTNITSDASYRILQKCGISLNKNS